MTIQLLEEEPTEVRTVQQAKQLLRNQNVDPETIDWASYPRDITITEWLQNEYGISLVTLKERVAKVNGHLELTANKKFYSDGVDWRKIAQSVKSIAVVGSTGSGKTGLVYSLLLDFTKDVYVFRHPKPKLIEELGYKLMRDLEELEGLKDCVVWIDEPQLHLKNYEKKSNDTLMKLLSMCRQLDITLIISTSDTRFINRGLESYIDVWAVKDMDWELAKNGSMVKNIIKSNSFISWEGLRLKVEEYIFHSRRFHESNGKKTFELPDFFNEEYSKPFKV